MTLTKWKNAGFLFFILAALILSVDTAIVHNIPYGESDRILGYAVLFDFACVIPFLYWLLIARTKGKSVLKLLPFTVAGALSAWFVLPADLRGMVWTVIWPVELVVIAAEIAFIGYEIRVLYRFIRRCKQTKRLEPDTGEALRKAVKTEFGNSRLASFFLHDLSLFYYLLFSWKRKRTEEEAGASLYTYHRKTSQILYVGIITHIVVFEAVVVHLLLAQVSHWAAWIVTAGDLWILSVIWADCRASVLRPVKLSAGMLNLRYGLRMQADVPVASIAAVTAAREFQIEPSERKRVAGPVIGMPNVRIELNRPVTVDGFLFQPREVTGIYLILDDPQQFVRDVNAARC